MRFANPARFKKLAHRIIPFAAGLCILMLVPGLYLGLIGSPVDAVQHDSVRIMYIHVPSAWVAMAAYASLGMAGICFLIWRHILAGLYIRAAAPVGMGFTAVCLVSGSLWGQPTWGTWWVWDARLTSVLVLFFLYVGIVALDRAFSDPEFGDDRGLGAASWLSVIGLINLPIIKFSVDWWNTLHQPASISSLARLENPAIAPGMLHPLLLMAGAFMALFVFLVLMRTLHALDDRQARMHAQAER